MRRTAIAALLALGASAAGCMPWALGETAETLRPGRIGLGTGVAALAPPIQPAEGLAVLQGWAGIGVVDGIDVRADYVVPATFHGAVKARFFRTGPWAAAATAGLGIHIVPDVRGYKIGYRTNFATGGLIVSRLDDAFRPYAAVRATVPYVLGEYPGATLWWSGVAGVELGRGAFRYGPELGFVVPTRHRDDWLLQVAFSVRRR